MSVAVVIPAFNRPNRLRRAVASVLGQTWSNFELVVVDDASTEDLSETREAVESAGHRWIRLKENQGPQVARNVGVAATSGEWITFLDSDDVWRPEKLKSQLAWHIANPEFEISQCEEVWIRDGVPIQKPKHLRQPATGRIFETCVERCCISATCVMLSRDLWNATGGFDERYWTCEDYELWLRIALEHEVGLLPEPLAEKHGGHPDQMSFSFRAPDRWRVLALMERIDAGLPEIDSRVAMEALWRKIGILRQGAEKRSSTELELFRAIETWVNANSMAPIPEDLLRELQESCFRPESIRELRPPASGASR